MVTKKGRHVRTLSLRHALNDLRGICCQDGSGDDLPAEVELDDGTVLRIAQSIAGEQSVGHKVGEPIPGVFEAKRYNAQGKRQGAAHYIP